MSSQVNKSKARFKPRVQRRARLDSNARRNSITISTTFSVASEREAFKSRASITESAIEDDDEFKLPGLPDASKVEQDRSREFKSVSVSSQIPQPTQPLENPLPTPEATVASSQGLSQQENEATIQDVPGDKIEQSQVLELPATVTQSESTVVEAEDVDMPQAELDDSESVVVAKPSTKIEPPSARISAPPSPKTEVKSFIPQPVQPLASAKLAVGPIPPETPEPEKIDEKIVVQDKEAHESEEEGSDGWSDREIMYDDEGREILEPRDLKRLGKYNAKVHYDNKVINADTFTMASLCTDVPLGKLTSTDLPTEPKQRLTEIEIQEGRYYKYEEGRTSRKREKALLIKAKQMIRGQYYPSTDERKYELLRIYKDWEDRRERLYGKTRETVDIDSLEAGPAQATLQLQVDKDGRIILDQNSQQIDRHKDNKADDEEENNKTRVEDNRFNTFINSSSFNRKERPERWSAVETDVFYQAISAWGTDFNLIAQFFPQRNRHQIKTKFKYEERRNPEKLQLYLVHKRSVASPDISRVSGHEIVPVEDIEAELEKVREEHAAQLQKEAEAKVAAAKEDADRKSQDHQRRRKAKGISGSSEVVGEIPTKKEED